MPDYNDLTYSLAGIRRKNPYDAKRQWGYEMLKAGSDASPVQHPLQGAARLAQALVGGWMGGKADRDEEKASKDYESKLAVAMAEPDPRKRIAMLPPEIGARMSGQLAVEEAKQQQLNAQRQQQAAAFGSMPPQGQGPQSAMVPPLPQGQPAPGGFNNNLGNIRATPIKWDGKGAPHNGFETFADPQHGANAMVKNLGAYVQRNPNITVAQAIAQWAPPNENNTDLYIRQVAEGTGINPAMPLAEVLQDPAVAAQMLDAITRKEKGGLPQGVNADTFMNATTPGGQQQPGQPLTINMGGPGQMPQGSADQPGMPPAPNPNVVGGPAVIAPPAVPDVPRPQPSPQLIAKLRQQIFAGAMTSAQAEAALNQELDRDWSVARERAKMQFDQQSKGYDRTVKQREALAGERESFDNLNSKLDRMAAEATRVLSHPGLGMATGTMAGVPGIGGTLTIPGTSAADFKASLETLKSQIGFSVLQEMRAASKTGGALGAVSDKENAMLQANLASLDTAQSVESFKAALQRIIEYTEASKGRIAAAYNARAEPAGGALVPQPDSGRPAPGADRGSSSDLRKKYGLE